MLEAKTCTKCGIEKPIAEFWFDRKKQRYIAWCRPCNAEARMAWKTANRERVRVLGRKWRSENPERVKRAQEAWKARNPGLAKQRAAEWYEKYKPTARARERQRYHSVKDAVYEAYGNKCNCCGESNRAFLSVDHVNNDGNQRRREKGYGVGRRSGGMGLYKTIVQEQFPPHYQILCMNCNFGKARNNGVCPHVTAKAQRPSREGVGASAPKRTALTCETVR